MAVSTPFAMTIDLLPEAEAYLFMDNDNQKTMNTAPGASRRLTATKAGRRRPGPLVSA
jgi:hypothetical protein